MNVLGSFSQCHEERISKENGYTKQMNSGNFHVMQRWSDESNCEMRLPLGALMSKGGGKGQSKSMQRCSGAINEEDSDDSRALSRLLT